MISEALRRSVVRYFRRAARSVWGEISRTPALRHQFGTSGEGVGKPFPSITSWAPDPTTGSVELEHAEAERVATIAAEVPAAAAPMPWRAWADSMASHQQYPGWSFCRFGIRGPGEHDCAMVTGLVHAPFGAAWSAFEIVNAGINYRARTGLASVTHTRSGYGIGLFVDMDTAIEAAEIALRMDDWSAFDVDPAGSRNLMLRASKAWYAAGIVLAPFRGYPIVNEEPVDPSGAGIAVFMRNPFLIETQRPEKLS